MSMEIDLSTPLSREEREYLANRGRYAELERADGMHGVESPELSGGDGTGPATHETTLTFVQEQRIAELERQLALLRGGDPEPDGGDSEDAADPYEVWTAEELKAEIDRRNGGRADNAKISKSGSKTDLANRLYADDDQA